MRNIFFILFVSWVSTILYSAYSSEAAINKSYNHSQDSLIRLLSEDVDFLVESINRFHPAPWRKISRSEFDYNAENLKNRIPRLTMEEFTIELMQLTAYLHDGHTIMIPNHPSFNKWFPVRFARFEDGIFIVAADIKYNALVGRKVKAIGGNPADAVFNRVGRCVSSDSQFGLIKSVPVFMSNAVLLKTLDLIQNVNELPVEIETSDKNIANIVIPSIDWQADPGWLESRFQIPGYANSINIFNNKEIDLPLHLKNLINDDINYWFEYLQEKEVIYMQFNAVADMKDESFYQFNKRLWHYYDSVSEHVNKFVLDLRYNKGGNGYLLKPLVHEIIKREKLNQRGHLFIIQGSNTFSAGVNCIAQIIKNTPAITVGEPTAGPLNWCSDIQFMELPNSKLMFTLSTLYWQEGHPSDTRGFYPPEFPVPVTFKDFSSGQDKALEAILEDKVETLRDILLDNDGESFKREINKRKALIQDSLYLIPYTETELREISQELLETDRRKDALIVLKLNTGLYPESWETWEDLGNFYSEQNDIKNAIECLEKSLVLRPGRIFTKYHLSGLKKTVK